MVWVTYFEPRIREKSESPIEGGSLQVFFNF